MSESSQDSKRAHLSARVARIEQTLSIASAPGETMRPTSDGVADPTRQQALESLLSAGRVERPEERIAVHDVLGMGGMGVVHRGTQQTLDREVALKAVRPDKLSRDATNKLLQEALISGALQHPNIIPVYDIGIGREGQPLIVQQRVEGIAWSELISSPDVVRERFHADDPLEWNLRVLMQVCNAAHFAHARGVLHLDIKPSNVMVGEFGEVFLLDWGLSMAVEDDGTGRLPLASENEDVIGTPAFIAPEMISQGDIPLTPKTDVYLLGATLYQACAGHPPHQGPTALATIYAAANKSPEPLDMVPDELARLCGRAMSFDAADRHGSAAALRLAIQDFLQHRGAVRLAEEATARLRELEQIWSSPTDDEEAGELQATEVHSLFSAAQFGLKQALAVWPEAPSANSDLTRLTVGMARWELARNHPQAAQTLLADVVDPPADLVAEVQAKVKELQELGARVDKLQAFRDDKDWRVGMGTRSVVLGILGLFFVAIPLGRVLTEGDSSPEWTPSIAVPISFLIILSVLLVIAREAMSRTEINRRTIGTAYVLFFGQILLTLVSQRLEFGVEQALPLLMTHWAVVGALFAVHVNRRFASTCLAYVAATALTLSFPAHGWWAATGASLAFLVNLAVVWRPGAGRSRGAVD